MKPPDATLSSTVQAGGAELIDNLAGEWRTLCKGRYDEPFYQPEWIAAYVRAFARGKNFVIVTVRSDGRLVAVLPLIREWGSIDGIPARMLRSAANVHTCRYDLVHDVACAEEVVSAVWRALQRLRGWDVLKLINLPTGAAAVALVRKARSSGCATHGTPQQRSPWLPLSQARGAALDRTDAKFRANLNRRMRKLQTRGQVALVHTAVPGCHLEQFYALELAGWKGAEGSAIACDPATRAFYDAVAHGSDGAGTLSFFSLECAGKPVAMHYGLAHRGRYFLLKTAYDEALSECSPGQLVTSEVIRDLTAQGYVKFEFLGPLMEWKRAWRPRLRPHADWYVLRGLAGHLLHALRFRLAPAVARALRRCKTPESG